MAFDTGLTYVESDVEAEATTRGNTDGVRPSRTINKTERIGGHYPTGAESEQEPKRLKLGLFSAAEFMEGRCRTVFAQR